MASRTRSPRLVVTAIACTFLAACGSQVPPSEVINAQVGQNAGGGAVGNGGAGGAAVPDAAGPAPAGGGTATGQNAGAAGGTGQNPGAGQGQNAGAGQGGQAGRPAGSRSTQAAGNVGAVPATSAGSCDGFKNGTGITDSTITIANASDVSGPVPGLFKSAQQAVQAYVAYFNATSSICGRKLALKPLDSGTNSSGDQQAAATACGSAFAMVGSMSAFDSGGAATVSKCGIPDLRAASTETARYKSPVSYGVYSLAVPEVPVGSFNYLKRLGGDAYQHAAFLYLDAGASSLNARSFIKAEQAVGYNFVYTQGIDVTTFNYDPYVTQMKNKGVKYVQYIGAYQNAVRLKKAMVAQNFKPMFVMDAVGYDKGFVNSGGNDVDGTYLFLSGPMFEETGRNPQLRTYLQWLQRTAPGASPSFFGVFAWGAAELFAQSAVKLGGKLTRDSLLAAVRNTHNYTDNGMFQPQDPGGKHTSPCQSIVQLDNGKWVRRSPYPYTCDGVVNSGVGG